MSRSHPPRKRKKVPKQFRNHGYSFGLEYPFIYAALPQKLPRKANGFALVPHEPTTSIWSVWHRHTGEVVWQSDLSPQLAQCLHEDAAMKKCHELNGSPKPDLAAIDLTP